MNVSKSAGASGSQTIRVTREEWEAVARAKKELAAHGYNAIPLQEPPSSIKQGKMTLGSVAAYGAALILELLKIKKK